MIMMKAKSDENFEYTNCTIMVEGDKSECVKEMVELLDSLTDKYPVFMTEVFDEMCNRRKNKR